MQRNWVPYLYATLLASAILAGGAVSLVRVRHILANAKPATPLLFDEGLSALDARQIPPGWTNASCGQCHQEAYDQWKRSRHYVAANNRNFRVQMLHPTAGRQQWCLNCHAPFNPGVTRLPTQEPFGIDAAFTAEASWLTQGVDCMSCHVRDGMVLGTNVTDKGVQAHPMREAPELATAEFCAGCHQFNLKHPDLPDELHGELQQASLDEFLEYRAAGGVETRCHDCHMPGGDHLMPGGYDDEMVSAAIELEISARWREKLQMVQVSVNVATGHVGHQLPGGEHLFRALSIRTKLEGRQGESVIPNLSASPAPLEGEQGKHVRKWPQVENIGFQPKPNTRMRPGEQRQFVYFMALDKTQVAGMKARAEVWYHLLPEHEIEVFGFSRDEMERVVMSEVVEVKLGAP